MALILASLFFKIDKLYVAVGNLHKMVAFPATMFQPAMTGTFVTAMASMYQFESQAGVCSPSQFLLQHQIHFLIWVHIAGTLFVLILYPLSFQGNMDPTKFAYSIMIVLLCEQAYLSFFMMICTLTRYLGSKSPKLAIIACSSVKALFAIFSGFFISVYDAPVAWRWAFYASPGYYAFTAAFRITCEDLYLVESCKSSSALSELLPCLVSNSGNVYLETYGYENIDPGVHAMVLLVLWIAFAGIALLLLVAHDRDIAICRTIKSTLSSKEVDVPKTVAEELQIAHQNSQVYRMTALNLARGTTLPADVSYGAKQVLESMHGMLGNHKVFAPVENKLALVRRDISSI